MRFETKEERDLLIKTFEAKAKELQALKESKADRDPNYNCRVDFDTRSEFDDVEYNDKNEIVSCSGDIYVFYLHQPTLTESIKILTAAQPPLGNAYNSGLEAFKVMVDKKESSIEVFTDRIKLGYLVKLVNKIDALVSDQKKR